jgi:hypothetical protein
MAWSPERNISFTAYRQLDEPRTYVLLVRPSRVARSPMVRY